MAPLGEPAAERDDFGQATLRGRPGEDGGLSHSPKLTSCGTLCNVLAFARAVERMRTAWRGIGCLARGAWPDKR
jgi:hypothetical protein